MCNHKFKPNDYAVSTIKLCVHDGCHPSWPNGKVFDLCDSCTKKVEKFLKLKK